MIASIDWPSGVAGYEPDIQDGWDHNSLERALTDGLRDERLSYDLKRLAAGALGSPWHVEFQRPEMVVRSLMTAVHQRRILVFYRHAWTELRELPDAEAHQMLALLAGGRTGLAMVVGNNFHNLSETERFAFVLRSAGGGLSSPHREMFDRLLGVEVLGIAADVLYRWSVSHLVPTGSVAQLMATLAPAPMWGTARYEQASLLHQAVALTRDARSLADLDRPARQVAQVVGRMGVMPFAELLARLRRRVRPRLVVKPEALAPEPVRPAPRAAMPPAPPAPPPETEMADVDEVALAEMLREAARLHVPFCIPCMLNRLKNAA